MGPHRQCKRRRRAFHALEAGDLVRQGIRRPPNEPQLLAAFRGYRQPRRVISHGIDHREWCDPTNSAITSCRSQIIPFFFNWGLIYMNSNVLELQPEFLRYLVPLVEVNFSTPVANTSPSVTGTPTHITTGTV